jgi:glycogen operon protein
MSEEHWTNDFAKSLGVYLNGRGVKLVGARGENVIDDSFYIIFNAHHEPLKYALPIAKYGKTWKKILDTRSFVTDGKTYKAGRKVTVEGRSIVILRHKILHT